MAETEKIIPLKIDTGNSPQSIKEMRDRLKELKDILVSTEKGTEQWTAAMQEAANIQHTMKDTTKELNSNAMDFGQVMSNSVSVVKGMAGALQSAQAVMTLMGVESEETAEAIKKMQASMAIIQGLSAFENGIKSLNRLLPKLLAGTKAQTIAQKALNAAMTPKVILAVVAAVTALVFAYKALTKESREAEKAREAELEAAKKSAEEYRNDVANAASTVLKKYEKLRQTWVSLSNETQKRKWIKENANEFKNLGVQVKSVDDAETVFVKRSKDMVSAFKLRAQAAAYGTQATKLYVQMIEAEEKVRQSFVESGQKVMASDLDSFSQQKGYQKLINNVWVWTEEGAKKHNEKLLKNSPFASYQQQAEEYVQRQIELEKEASDLIGDVADDVVDKVKTKSSTSTDIEDPLKVYRDLLEKFDKESKSEYARIMEQRAKDFNALEMMKNFLGLEGDDYERIKNYLVQKYDKLIKDAIEVVEDEEFVEGEEERINGLVATIDKYHSIFDTYEEQQQKAYQEALTVLEEMEANSLITHEQYLEKKKQLDEQYRTYISKNAQQQIGIYANMASNIGSTLTSIGDLYAEVNKKNGEVSQEVLERQKALQIAGVVVSTLGGIASMTNSVWSSPDTGEFWAKLALQIVMTTEMLTTMGVQIAQIKNQNLSGSGASSSVSSSAVGALNVPTVYTQDVNGSVINDNIKDQRVYVVESDITDTQRKVSVSETENRY